MYEPGTVISITDIDNTPLPDEVFPPGYFYERHIGQTGEVMCGFNTLRGAAYLVRIHGEPTFLYASEIECYAEVSFKDKKEGGLGDWLNVGT